VGNLNCGPAADAINYCATLTYAGRSDWYLPSQKELLMAYIDGMMNKAGTTLTNAAAFTTANITWSSSEVSGNTARAWDVLIGNGYSDSITNKSSTATIATRCVSRD
jgi:hypothetical protein